MIVSDERWKWYIHDIIPSHLVVYISFSYQYWQCFCDFLLTVADVFCMFKCSQYFSVTYWRSFLLREVSRTQHRGLYPSYQVQFWSHIIWGSCELLVGKKLLGRSHVRHVAQKRMKGINEYCKVSDPVIQVMMSCWVMWSTRLSLDYQQTSQRIVVWWISLRSLEKISTPLS